MSWTLVELHYDLIENIMQGDCVICRLKNKSDEKDCSVSNEREPSSASVSVWGNQAADGMNEVVRENMFFVVLIWSNRSVMKLRS